MSVERFDMTALKPCPFCGNDGSGPIEDALHVIHSEPDWEHGDNRHTWSVQCDKCTATMGYSDSEDEAIEAWNRRAPQPAPQLAERGWVAVKALEWTRYNADRTIHIATALPGEYWAWELAGFGYWSWGTLSGREVPGGLAEAKAAAQADYERRILAALVPSERRQVTAAMVRQIADAVFVDGWRTEDGERLREALEAALGGAEGAGWRIEAEATLKAVLEYLRGQTPATTAGSHRNGSLRNRIKWVLLGCGGPLREDAAPTSALREEDR